MSPSEPPCLLVACPPGDLPPEVLQTTVKLAVALNASVRVVTVVAAPTADVPHTSPAPATGGELTMATHIVQAALEPSLNNLRAVGVDCSVCARQGSPAQAILDEAAAVQPEFIIVGTRGHSGLRRALLGSVAEGVIRKADHPVVVVRPSGST